jgi:hypothetical protein
LPHPLPSWKDIIAEDIFPEFFGSLVASEQVPYVDLLLILDDLGSDVDEDDIAASDDESAPGDDSGAAEDARSYDGGETDD